MQERLRAIPVSRRAARFRLEVAVVLLLAFLSAPAAAEKFDLSPYLGPPDTVGDFKVIELSTGDMMTLEVVAVAPEKNGYRVTTRVTQTGQDPILGEGLVIPGKRIFLCDEHTAGLLIRFEKPLAIAKFKTEQGKLNKIHGSGRAFYEGTRVGNAAFGGSWVFVGLEPLETPVASYPETAVLRFLLTLTVKSRFNGSVLRAKEEWVGWHAPGIGQVAERYRASFWVDGTLVHETDWIDAWLIDGSLGGEPIP